MCSKKSSFDQLPERIEEIASRMERVEAVLQEIHKRSGQTTEEKLFNVKQAAEFLELKVATLYSKASRGEIPHSKRGNRLIFSKTRLIEWSLQGERESISEKRRAHIKKMQEARKRRK